MTKEERKEYSKAYNETHKEELKSRLKAYYAAHKQETKALKKAYYQAHKEEVIANKKAYYQAHKDERKAYFESDMNSLGQTKYNIRQKSGNYLRKYGKKIPGYQIHHCFTYDDPTKFIYCSKSLHLKIHEFLRENNIDADSNHYEQIKHLLDDTVIIYGI